MDDVPNWFPLPTSHRRSNAKGNQMTTPKELAYKAWDLALTCDNGRSGPAMSGLLSAINQLQAMAEARQGSGEPVAAYTEASAHRALNHLSLYNGPGRLAEATAMLVSAPPSAGDRTHIADLTDTFEQLRKIVGTPEQDADALIAAVRTLATTPPAQQATGSGEPGENVAEWKELYELRAAVKGPDGFVTWQDAATDERIRRVKAERALAELRAQQATGSGQVLADEPCDCGCLDPSFTDPMEALRFLSARFKYAGVNEAVAKGYARDIDTILAAATQAKPEVPAGWKLVPVEPTDDMLAAARVNRSYPSCTDAQVWSAMLFAAPTTGKREPLTREGCHYLCNAGSVCNKCGHVHGITGEQR